MTDGLVVSVERQQMDWLTGGVCRATFPISTSQFGLGSEPGSYKTPLGLHLISEKHGDGLPLGAVLKSRLWTGEVWSAALPSQGEDDLVLSRILWLEGCEESNATTKSRYIYIHGTNHEHRLGTPASHGCIRMANSDILLLFDSIAVGTSVLIA